MTRSPRGAAPVGQSIETGSLARGSRPRWPGGRIFAFLTPASLDRGSRRLDRGSHLLFSLHSSRFISVAALLHALDRGRIFALLTPFSTLHLSCSTPPLDHVSDSEEFAWTGGRIFAFLTPASLDPGSHLLFAPFFALHLSWQHSSTRTTLATAKKWREKKLRPRSGGGSDTATSLGV